MVIGIIGSLAVNCMDAGGRITQEQLSRCQAGRISSWVKAVSLAAKLRLLERLAKEGEAGCVIRDEFTVRFDIFSFEDTPQITICIKERRSLMGE
jgi:hypothetical protein